MQEVLRALTTHLIVVLNLTLVLSLFSVGLMMPQEVDSCGTLQGMG